MKDSEDDWDCGLAGACLPDPRQRGLGDAARTAGAEAPSTVGLALRNFRVHTQVRGHAPADNVSACMGTPMCAVVLQRCGVRRMS